MRDPIPRKADSGVLCVKILTQVFGDTVWPMTTLFWEKGDRVNIEFKHYF